MDPIFFNHRTGKPLTPAANRRVVRHLTNFAAQAGWQDAHNAAPPCACPFRRDPFRQAWLKAHQQATAAILHA